MSRHLPTLCASLAIAAATTALAPIPSVHACGGCLSPTDQVTAVDSHRMVISIGLEETVLWDQIIYEGDPDDFVWLMPVPTEQVSIELADPEFFNWIDRGTAPVVQAPSFAPVCPVDSAGFGCGGAVSDSAGGGETSADGVTVFDESVVGPYETVTIGSEDPSALYTWLQDNGYQVSPAAFSAIDFYIEHEFVFVALRLAPDQGETAITPVRIRYPSFMGTFPLKMVVVGAKGLLNLSLWVIAEQRYDVPNYGSVQVDPTRISFDWAQNTSDYAEVFEATVQENGNRAWVTEYADRFDRVGMGPFPLPWEPAPPEADEDINIIQGHNGYPYITRLRTRVLVEHVDEDLQLAPAQDSSDVDRLLIAGQESNYPVIDCGDDDGAGCGVGRNREGDIAVTLLLIGFACFIGLRRRRRTADRTC